MRSAPGGLLIPLLPRAGPMSKQATLIAIVEDDASVRDALRSLLASAGYSVLSFESATAFLAEREAHVIACLIIDAQMPGVSGLLLQSRLLAMNVTTPIIFVTGRANAVREKALERGAVAVLGKPFAADELLEAVQSAIGGAPGRPGSP